MKLTKPKKSAALKVHDLFFESYINGDIDQLSSLLMENFSQIGSAEVEVFFTKKDALEFVFDTIDQVAGKLEMRNRTTKQELFGDFVLIFELCDLYVLIENKWTFYSRFRATSVLQEKPEGWKILHQHSSFPDSKAQEGENIALETISEENLQLRDAIKRRTVELENKNRELEIEAALEKVRGVAMAMQKSEDILNVCKVMFQVFPSLGIADLRNTLIHFWDDASQSLIDYDYSDFSGGNIAKLSYSSHPIFDQFQKKIRESKDAFSQLEITKDQLESWKKRRKDSGEYEDSRLDKIDSLYYYFYSIGIGAVGLSSFSRLTMENLEVLKRFCNVFDLAYRRYHDIEKAEAQTREAKIEAALERVRATAMGMQRSEDLKTVVGILYGQLRNLEFKMGVVSIIIMDHETGDMDWWNEGFGDGYVLPECYHVPFFEHQGHLQQLKLWKSGTSYGQIEISGKDKKSYDAYYFYQTDFSRAPELTKQLMMQQESLLFSMAFMKYGALSWSPTPLSKDQATILERFAKVFEQTYTRFLDLKKAEAQAREAQIEAALEKVRSRSLAMHKSEELSEVVKTVVEKMQDLDIEMNGGISLVTFEAGSHDFQHWLWIPGRLEDTFTAKVVGFDHPILADCRAAQDQGLELLSKVYGKKEKQAYFKHLFEKTDFKFGPKETQDWVKQQPFFGFSFAIQKHSGIFLNDYSGNYFSQETNDILIRFSRVFEQAYTRFLDLQKAEAQGREAQIEAALERVRSRSLAMKRSEELQEVVTTVFDRLKELNIQTDAINLDVFNENKKDAYLWTAVPGHSYSKAIHIPYTDATIFKDIYEGMISGKSMHSKVYSRESKDEFLTYIFEHTDFRDSPQKRKDFLYSADASTISVAYAKNTAIIAQRYRNDPFSEVENEILRRFAKVFEQSYTRFLDLQKAEAQAREAQVEVALERIRARALAMQSSTELSDVANVLREQMGILGQEDLEASVVHLYSEGSPTFDSWYAFRAGEKIIEGQTTFQLENSALAKEFLKLYLDEITEYTIEVKGEKLNEWLAEIKNNAPEIAAYWGDLPPEKQFYHFSDFSGGALLMVTHQTLSEETRMLQKRCAWVFELAYKRFLDLVAKERQDKELREEKQRLEKALTELKATQSQLIQSEKMASLGQLTAGIAHEIKNPLNFINNFSEVSIDLIREIQQEREKIQESRDETLIGDILEDIKKNLQKVHEHGKRADGIVKSMLQHSRSSGSKTESTAFNPLIREFSNLAYHGMRAGKSPIKVEIELQLDPEVGEIKMISEDISRVILNLCNNAFDAIREKLLEAKTGQVNFVPKLIISTKKASDQEIQLTIKDNGKGIPKEIIDKILEPFFTTKKGTEGTGLGLSISYDIIKAHGGKLEVRSTLGIGTEFVIQLPIGN